MGLTTTILDRLFPSRKNSAGQTLGDAGAVLEAIWENTELEYKYVGTLGEPDIIDRGGQHTTDLYVVVPLTTEHEDHPDPSNLEYPLPEGPDDKLTGFYGLLTRFDIQDIELLGELEGEEVPLHLVDGSLVPVWDEI